MPSVLHRPIWKTEQKEIISFRLRPDEQAMKTYTGQSIFQKKMVVYLFLVQKIKRI